MTNDNYAIYRTCKSPDVETEYYVQWPIVQVHIVNSTAAHGYVVNCTTVKLQFWPHFAIFELLGRFANSCFDKFYTAILAADKNWKRLFNVQKITSPEQVSPPIDTARE